MVMIETVIFVVQNIDEQKRRELEYQNQILETAEEARQCECCQDRIFAEE